jgi:hypothetical protein
MSRIRVHMTQRGSHLHFEGRQEFFERAVEPLFLVAAGGGAPRRKRVAVAAPPTNGAARAEKPPKPSYRPPAPHFGTFQRQVGEGLEHDEDRLAAYAFFLWNYERKEVFREEEIRGCFAADGTPPPAESGPLYERLARRRMLVPDGKPGTWRLTSKGRDHVRHHLLSAS